MDIDPTIPPAKSSAAKGSERQLVSDNADSKDKTWSCKFQLMSRDFDELMRKTRGQGNKRWEERESLLRGLLEAEMMLGQSIDQMRDCLLRFKAAGYPVENDFLL